jgi:hypothetical protein
MTLAGSYLGVMRLLIFHLYISWNSELNCLADSRFLKKYLPTH